MEKQWRWRHTTGIFSNCESFSWSTIQFTAASRLELPGDEDEQNISDPWHQSGISFEVVLYNTRMMQSPSCSGHWESHIFKLLKQPTVNLNYITFCSTKNTSRITYEKKNYIWSGLTLTQTRTNLPVSAAIFLDLCIWCEKPMQE